MALGRSIRIYLDGGEVSGIRHAELVNWTGQAILCPRSRMPELIANWDLVAQRPGVYFLVGAEQLTTREVYLGESESVLGRLQEHINRDFWEEAIFFTSKDENLTKAHIKFLESRLVEQAIAARRYKVLNQQQPTKSGLPRADADAMEEFLGHMRLLLGALGHRFLDPVDAMGMTPLKPGKEAVRVFSFGVKGAAAHGVLTDEGFVVQKGSTALKDATSSMGSGYAAYRAELVDSGKLKLKGGTLVFTDNVLFNSASAAASVVCGYAANGRVSWRAADGKTLKEIEAEQVAQAE